MITSIESDKYDNHKDAIEKIFQKILKWKKLMGDSERQEEMVSNYLKPKKPLKIHNINTALVKMNELKGKIGLTDLECYFIIFSSIDHDYFNHLLLK